MTDEKKPPEGGMVPAIWRVEVSAEGVHMQRLNADGFAIERYGVVPHAVGAVRLVAIAHSFQPPRDLRPHDPVGQGGQGMTALRLQLHLAEAELKKGEAVRTTCPLRRELLAAESNLSFLRAKQIADHQMT